MAIITQKNVEPCRDQIIFTFEKEKIDETVNEIAKEIGKKFTIKGFRKGKAPISAIKIAAKETILKEASRRLMNDAYQDILFETKLKPFGEPEVSKIDISFSDFKVCLNLAYMPDFELGQYKDFDLDEPKNLPNKEELIKKTIMNLCKKHPELRSYEEEDFVVDDDTVVVDYKVFMGDNEVEENAANDVMIDVGGGKYLRDFELNIMGMKLLETKTFEIVFPEDASNKNLAGEKLKFEVVLKTGLKKEYPEFNEDLAKKLGLENFEALNKSVLTHVDSQIQSVYKNTLKKVIFDKLLESTTIDVPAWMQEYSAKVLSQSNKLEWDTNDDSVKQHFLTEGLKTLKLSMIFEKIREMEVETVLTEQELQSILQQNFGKLPADIQKSLIENQNVSMLSKLYSEIQDEQVFEWIIKNSKIVKQEQETVSNEETSVEEVKDQEI